MMNRFAKASSDKSAVIAVLALLASLLIGGGGSPSPLPELVLQGLLVLLALAWLAAAPDSIGHIPRSAWWLAGLILALPALQLFPLPPAIWQSLPGRAGQQAALELIGQADSWRAVSLSPARTLAALLAAVSALFMLILASTLDNAGRWRLIVTIAVVGLLSLLVGAAQISMGSRSFFRFYNAEFQFISGFQANRNSTADILLVTILAVSALSRRLLDRGWAGIGRWQLAVAIAGFDAVMILGLVFTGSRAGLLLLPVVLLFQFFILQPDSRLRWRRLGISLAAVVALAAIALWALRSNRVVTQVLARFTPEGEFRPELWRDSLYALNQYWPAGSGQGTFVPVMIAVERLEVVDPTLPNRAHNDYLELAIGGGLPGLILLGAIAIWLGLAMLRAVRQSSPAGRPQVLFAIGVLTVFALHSLVDYPLRSMSLAAVAAVAVGLLLPVQRSKSNIPGGKLS